MRQHSWRIWVLIFIATAAVILVGSLAVLYLPQPWQWLVSLAVVAIGEALAFWANVFGVGSKVMGWQNR